MVAYKIYSPLRDFQWAGKQFSIAKGVAITDAATPPKVSDLATHLAKPEWERAKNVRHWLQFEWTDDSPTRQHEVLNIVLLSLWIANPTQTRIEFSFKIAENEQGPHGVTRHLDRFQYIQGKHFIDYTDTHLTHAAHLFGSLLEMYLRRGRLNPALLLTLTGCWSIEWSTALICHAAAAEALLTYSTGRRLTRRLATTFACLTKSEVADRNAAYGHFYDLYRSRSDIMHGRTHNIAEGDRLAALDKWQDAVRAIWSVACDSPPLLTALEGSDDDRRRYLLAMQQGFAIP